ncbi:hypothetical protein WK00_29090 [Burkholderia ubonensis]|nr:hypothetical protein WK00_29090 [Burkholderia ubonensis]
MPLYSSQLSLCRYPLRVEPSDFPTYLLLSPSDNLGLCCMQLTIRTQALNLRLRRRNHARQQCIMCLQLCALHFVFRESLRLFLKIFKCRIRYFEIFHAQRAP